MNRTQRAASGVFTSFLQYGVQICLQIILIPVILRAAGQETLGAYAIIMQAIGYLALVDLGISLALTRFSSHAFGYEDGGQRFRNVLSAGRAFLLCTNTAFAVLSLMLCAWAQMLFSLSPSVSSEARWGLAAFAGWAVVRTPWMVFSHGLYATQNLAVGNLIALYGNAARLLASLGLVTGGMGLAGLIVGNILGEVLSLVLYSHRFKKLYPHLRPSWGIQDRNLFRDMYKFGAHSMLMNVSWRLITGTDYLVLNYLYSASAASIYYTTQMPAVIGYNLVNKLVDNVGPAINELYARNDIPALREAYVTIQRYTLLLVSPLVIGLVLFNRKAITLWVGAEQYAGDIMTYSLAIFVVFTTIGHVNLVFVLATGRIGKLSTICIIEGIGNVAMSLYLGRIMGLAGVMIAKVVTHVPTVIYLQCRGMTEFSIMTKEYFRTAVGPAVISSGMCLSMTIMTIQMLPKEGYLTFVASGGILAICAAGSSLLFGLNHRERAWFKGKYEQISERVIANI